MALQVVSVVCDWGAGQPGGAAGVMGWYQLALHYKHLAWLKAEHHAVVPSDLLAQWVGISEHPYAHRIEAWAGVAEQVRALVASLPLEKKTLFLTGDHSWAGVILQALVDRIPRLGVLWIDAHADFHNPATSPSGNLHGMPLAMATGLNTHRYHPVPEATWELWEAQVWGGLAPSQLLMVGLRSYEPPEKDLLDAHQIPYFLAQQLHREGMQPAIEAARALAERSDALYVSLDVDVWDPSFARGTTSPAPAGLSIAQVRTFLEEIWDLPQTRFVEVTEINPLLDRDNQTALYAYGTVRPFVDGEGAAGME
uniref:Arginase n=1 Tax=uncultured Bacteroidota bacterium TaxID=152509 RepID=H5SK39_9BACT|nr:arginase [uncultured Bacteroidetes bacterium]